HLDPKAAAIKSMEQVTGPVIATTLVLLAMSSRSVSCRGSPVKCTASSASPSRWRSRFRASTR
ncbi:hypothetical protein, partial [Victivallis vadensis]|uniref:hypothetical protein n=1 Tax=Victivallis vadensis TaxID=172901 RepID=UPI001C9C1042